MKNEKEKKEGLRPFDFTDEERKILDSLGDEETSATLLNFVVIVGVFAAFVSVVFNISFAWRIGESMSDFAAILMVCLWLSLDAGKYVLPYMASVFWRKGNHLFSAGMVFLVVVLSVLSVFAGQGMIAGNVEAGKQKAIASSDAYRDYRSEIANLQGVVDGSRIDVSTLSAARAELERLTVLQMSKQSICNGYAAKRNYESKTDACNASLALIVASIAAKQAVVDRGMNYNAALHRLETLRSTPPHYVHAGSIENPAFSNVSNLTHSDIGTVKSSISIISGLSLEMIASLFIFVYGMMKTQRKYTMEESISASVYAVRMMRIKGHTDGVISNQPDVIDVEPIKKKDDDATHVNAPLLRPEDASHASQKRTTSDAGKDACRDACDPSQNATRTVTSHPSQPNDTKAQVDSNVLRRVAFNDATCDASADASTSVASGRKQASHQEPKITISEAENDACDDASLTKSTNGQTRQSRVVGQVYTCGKIGCQNRYTAKKSTQLYCSPKCRKSAHVNRNR